MAETVPVPIFPHPVRTEWKMLAQLCKDNPSITQDECAKQLGVNANTIRNWKRQPLYQSFENWFLQGVFDNQTFEQKKSRADIQEELDEFAQEMLGKLRDIAETSNDTKLVAQIGFDVLDRAGYSAVRKEGQRPISFILTAEALQELARRTQEMRSIDAVVVGQP